jgi:hypothetical protein
MYANKNNFRNKRKYEQSDKYFLNITQKALSLRKNFLISWSSSNLKACEGLIEWLQS